MTHTETITSPKEVHGESGEPRNRPIMPIARVGVDYVFEEQFGKAYVSYLFPVNRTIILENGEVTWVEFLTPGMRMKLEDGSVATVTKTSPPQLFNVPPDKPDSNGLQTKRVLGTIKRVGSVAIDIMVGGRTITTTPAHQFYSVTRNAFVCAIELRPNELLRNDRGGTTPVQAIGRPRTGGLNSIISKWRISTPSLSAHPAML